MLRASVGHSAWWRVGRCAALVCLLALLVRPGAVGRIIPGPARSPFGLTLRVVAFPSAGRGAQHAMARRHPTESRERGMAR